MKLKNAWLHTALAGAMALTLACAAAAPTVLPPLAAGHPRLLVGSGMQRDALRQRIQGDAAMASQLESIKARVQPYVERHRTEPDWIVSRLQMYWQARHTQVYVKNGLYARASGQAPVPTVRFTGARDTNTAYMTPRLEDVKPYMGENDRLYLQNKEAPGQPWEWVEQVKTGRIIEAINVRITELARDAAFLYWYTGDESYARFAYDIFDTYMSGMYYREMPIDLTQGHDGTIVGLQSFEVIHEDTSAPLAESYDFMHDYVVRRAGDKRALYDGAFKKWADVILTNGVAWNNWNLIKARSVLQIAAVLDADRSYADQRGKEHYLRAVIDGSGSRQWSLKRLLDYGFDADTGIWNESPVYSINVVGDYLECLEMLERVFGIDLLPQMPVLPRAINALPQYLLPNGRMAGFGDSKYDFLRTAPIEQMQAYAEHHGKHADAKAYATLLAAVRAASPGAPTPRANIGLHGLLSRAQAPASTVVAAPSPDVRAYQTPTFFAPNVSWLIQRNGYQDGAARDNALVISQVGSSGNHAHANGIAMELYAKGLSLVPESGRGSGYLQYDHLDYYAQFPAHNTVVVDGMSAYPSMKSDHPLTVHAVYPKLNTPAAAAFPLATFSSVGFTEPAADALQMRVLGTVRLDDKNGYFVDIFRSRRRNGKDRYHDYIYHNLGQSMRFMSPAGQALSTVPTDKLAFADGDLKGYDFWRNRQLLKSALPLTSRVDLKLPERALSMTTWLQGAATREFISVQAPPSTAWPAGLLPAGIDKLPSQTLVIRQTGEAWTRPFTAVMEAAEGDTPGSVLAVEEIIPATSHGHALALRVSTLGERRQTIIANDGDGVLFAHADQRLVGRYGIVATRAGELDYLFLGHGREAAGQGFAIVARKDDTAASLWQAQGRWFYTASHPAQLRVPGNWPRELVLGNGTRLRARSVKAAGRPALVFDMPAMAAAPIR